MTELVRGSSSVFRIEAHVSFKTKYCRNAFDIVFTFGECSSLKVMIVEFRDRCTELLPEAAADIGVEITEIGYDRNHVHLDIRWMRISLSIDRVAKKLKGTTGRKLLKEFPGIKKRFFWGSGMWSPVIYGDSLGREPDQIREYIRNQGMESSVHAVSLARL